MSLFRESLGEKFEQYKADGSASRWMDEPLSVLDRDELLALVGWMAADRKREQDQHRRDAQFMSLLRRA